MIITDTTLIIVLSPALQEVIKKIVRNALTKKPSSTMSHKVIGLTPCRIRTKVLDMLHFALNVYACRFNPPGAFIFFLDFMSKMEGSTI